MTDSTATRSSGLSRWKASGIHLLVSAAVAAVSLFLVLWVWYPPPLFTAEGGSDILFILIAVDVIVGPLITLIIFRTGKPGLRFDLSVIALMQAGALAYGVHVMFVARPVYIALVDDQFETVRANDLHPDDVAKAPPAFRSVPVTGPAYVAVKLPQDLKLLRELIAQTQKSGDVVQHLPEYYAPYPEYKAEALAKGRPLVSLQETDKDLAGRIDLEIADTGHKASELKFLQLQTRRGWGAVLLDGKTGDIVKMLPPSVLQLSLTKSVAPNK